MSADWVSNMMMFLKVRECVTYSSSLKQQNNIIDPLLKFTTVWVKLPGNSDLCQKCVSMHWWIPGGQPGLDPHMKYTLSSHIEHHKNSFCYIWKKKHFLPESKCKREGDLVAQICGTISLRNN